MIPQGHARPHAGRRRITERRVEDTGSIARQNLRDSACEAATARCFETQSLFPASAVFLLLLCPAWRSRTNTGSGGQGKPVLTLTSHGTSVPGEEPQEKRLPMT